MLNLIFVENVFICLFNVFFIELFSLLGNLIYKVMMYYVRYVYEREYELIDVIKGNKIELIVNDICDLVNN